MFMWTIYNSPSDYPNKFVVRKFNYDSPTDEVKVFDTLEEARIAIPRHLYCMPRLEDDDPCIVEVWF